jgi:hypothetical protein
MGPEMLEAFEELLQQFYKNKEEIRLTTVDLYRQQVQTYPQDLTNGNPIHKNKTAKTK